jgi:hypothetical protein
MNSSGNKHRITGMRNKHHQVGKTLLWIGSAIVSWQNEEIGWEDGSDRNLVGAFVISVSGV